LLHFTLLSSESETEHDAANSQMQTSSVHLVSELCACKPSRLIAAAAAAVASALK